MSSPIPFLKKLVFQFPFMKQFSFPTSPSMKKKNSFFLKFHILKTFFFFQILFITRSGFSNFQNRKYSISINSNYEKKTIFPKSYMRDFYAFSNSVDENFNYGIQIPLIE